MKQNYLKRSKSKVAFKEPEYYYAYDRNLGRRIVHVKRGNWLISLATGTKRHFKGESK